MNTIHKELLDNIKKDLDITESLLHSLEAQKQAFEQRNIEKFEKITEQQDPLFHQLKNIQMERDRFLVQHSLPVSKQGLRELLSKIPPSEKPHLEIHWEKLLKLKEQLKHLMTSNKMMIDMGHAQVSQVLNILYDRNHETTYGSKAETLNPRATRPISEA